MRLKTWALALMGAALLLACRASPVPVESPEAERGIQVSGLGTASAAPDIATLLLHVEMRDPRAQAAWAGSAQAMERVLAALKEQGVAEEAIRTTSLSLQRVAQSRGRDQVVWEYVGSQSITVTLRSLDRLGTQIDRAVAAGGDAVRVDGITLGIEDLAALLAQARAKAMAEAGAKARQLAQLSGLKLGSPLSISEFQSSWPAPLAAFGKGGEAMGLAETPISPGTLEVQISVQVRYAIEP